VQYFYCLVFASLNPILMRMSTNQPEQCIPASLIIRLFQLVFSAGTVFFSHNKSAGTVFRLIFSAKRTGLGIKPNIRKRTDWKCRSVRLIIHGVKQTRYQTKLSAFNRHYEHMPTDILAALVR